MKQLTKLVGLSQPTIFRLRQRGDFPKPIELSPGAKGYLLSDIESWLKHRSAQNLTSQTPDNRDNRNLSPKRSRDRCVSERSSFYKKYDS